jgi:hypothetical protein
MNDPGYTADIAETMGLNAGTAKWASAPAATTKQKQQADDFLDEGLRTKRRAVIGKLLLLLNDRPDLKYITGRLAAQVGRPTATTWAEAKRAARYLLANPVGATILEPRRGDVEAYFPHSGGDFDYDPAGWDPYKSEGGDRPGRRRTRAATARTTADDDDEEKDAPETQIDTYADSDWAGDLATRRSVSGGLLYLRGALVTSWSRRQATVALSSAEAELAAMTTATDEPRPHL